MTERERRSWRHTSTLIASLATLMTGDEFDVDRFNPYAEVERPTMDARSMLTLVAAFNAELGGKDQRQHV